MRVGGAAAEGKRGGPQSEPPKIRDSGTTSGAAAHTIPDSPTIYSHAGNAVMGRSLDSGRFQREPHGQLGNRAMMALLRGGRLRAKTISAPSDADERTADRLADVLVAGGSLCGGGCEANSCDSCAAKAQRKAIDGGRATAPSEGVLPTSSGSPLDAATRDYFEPRLGRDLGDVRVHHGSEAAAASQQLAAHGFTVGRDIAFAEGRYAPGTVEGRRLLAHELVHVVQQSTGGLGASTIQREANPASSTVNPAAVQLDMDPCQVDVPSLTNETLALQLNRADAYLVARRKGQDDYYAYANLLRRLVTENRRRMRMGHLWLGEKTAAMPSSLYRLSSGVFGEVVVTEANIEAERGAPVALDGVAVMTPAQLNHFLTSQQIPQVDAAAFFARQRATTPLNPLPLRLVGPPGAPVRPPQTGFPAIDLGIRQGLGQGFLPNLGTAGIAGGQIFTSPYDLFGRPSFSRNIFPQGFNAGAATPRQLAGYRSEYRGDLPEIGLGYGNFSNLLSFRDLNRIQQDFPIFDFRQRFTQSLISVKSVVPTGFNPAAPNQTPANFQTYYHGFDDMVGAQQVPSRANRIATLNDAVTLLNQNYGTMSQADVINSSVLAINDDHVLAFRQDLEARIVATPANYERFFDASLSDSPLTIGAESFSSWQALETARARANSPISQADFDNTLRRLSRRASSRVIGSGFTTEQLFNLQSMRENLAVLSPREFNLAISPEYIEATRFGGGAAAVRAAIGRSMMRGAGGGMIIAGGMDLASMLWDPDAHPHKVRELVTNVGLGAEGGFVASGVESSINMAFSTRFATMASGGVETGILGPLASRGLGGFAAGGVAAPLVTLTAMALDDQDYTAIDYTAKGTRAFVSGSLAGAGGALAAAGTGALLGSEVPIVGNIVGFFVGLGVYYIVDSTVGDSVEGGVRYAMGEEGCPRPPPPVPLTQEQLDAAELRAAMHCFVGDTRVLMADGTSRPIEHVAPGDRVTGWDEETGDLRTCPVLAVRKLQVAEYLRMQLEDGVVLRATAGHPVRVGDGWVPAGLLVPGDVLLRLDSALPTLQACTLMSVERVELTQTVYDLSVGRCHTFFAEGVLVHNKNI